LVDELWYPLIELSKLGGGVFGKEGKEEGETADYAEDTEGEMRGFTILDPDQKVRVNLRITKQKKGKDGVMGGIKRMVKCELRKL